MVDQLVSGRPTIGVLFNEFDGMYQRQVRFGMEQAARERGANLIFFVGKALLSPYDGENQHIITYSLAGKERLDALVLMTGSLANFCGEDFFMDRIRSFFSPLPMVSIAWKLPGIPSLVVDNKSGIRQVMNHLIQVHQRKKIAFIRGPLANFEADERFHAYRETLEENGLPFDPELVYVGDFVYNTGAVAVRSLLDDRKVCIDSLVSSNDDMLVTACLELHRRGFKVPQDISVTGYDDLERAEYMTPPYTTVSQPLFEQGKKAVELLLDELKGAESPELISIPSKMIIRESCGCLPEAATHSKRIIQYNDRDDLIERISLMLAPEIERSRCVEMIAELVGWLERFEEIAANPGGFMAAFNQMLFHSIIEHWRIRSWSQVIAALKVHFLFVCSEEGNQAPIISELLHRCQMMVAEAIWRQSAGDRIPLYDLFWDVRDFVIRTNSSFQMDDFATDLNDKLPAFGINTCLIALYHPKGRSFNQHKWVVPPKVQLAVAWVEGKICKFSEEHLVYPAQRLFPEGLFPEDQPYCLVVQPLFIGDEQYGFLVLDRADCEPMIYATLREQVSCVIRTMQLFNRKQKAEEKLKATLKDVKSLNKELHSLSLRDQLTGLYNRRGFMLLWDEHLSSNQASGGNFILFFMDLDGLKAINDNFGHVEGDIAIRAIAKILKKTFREPTDLIARFGGDEFIAIAFGCCDEQSENIRVRVERLMNDYNRTHGAKPYRLQLSIGSTVFDGQGSADFDRLLSEADQALYREKKSKTNQLRRGKK